MSEREEDFMFPMVVQEYLKEWSGVEKHHEAGTAEAVMAIRYLRGVCQDSPNAQKCLDQIQAHLIRLDAKLETRVTHHDVQTLQSSVHGIVSRALHKEADKLTDGLKSEISRLNWENEKMHQRINRSFRRYLGVKWRDKPKESGD